MKYTTLVLLLCSLVNSSHAAFSEVKTIRKDVAIIGGGASGTYAAIRLKEDYKKSVIIVEKQGRLGGHVSPYIDPQTGDYVDMGVQTFLEYGPARAFFARLDVPTRQWAPERYPIVYADFNTGNIVNFTAPALVPAVQSAAQIFLMSLRPTSLSIPPASSISLRRETYLQICSSHSSIL